MAKKAELKAVLKLDNAHFVREIRKSIRFAKDLAKQFARQPISTTFLAGLLTARQAIKATASGFEAIASMAKKAFVTAGITAGVAAGAILLIAKNSIEAAAQAETLRSSFTVLLGSAQKSSQRMRELLAFANSKGLRLTNVAEASRVLETLTRGALSTGKGLEMVGDVAAGTKQPFDEMAVTIGRLYDAMRSGQGGGQELARLQELGAITGQARRRIEALGSAKFGAEGWKLAQQELSRYSGMLQSQSNNWERLMERFHDSIEEAMRQFGTPLMEALKPTLDAASNAIFTAAQNLRGTANEFADGMSEAIDILAEFFSDPSSAIGPLMDLLRAGFAAAGNVLIAALEAGIKLLLSPSLYTSMAEGFWGVAQMAGGYFIDAFKKPIAYMQASIEALYEAKSNLVSGGVKGAMKGAAYGLPGMIAGMGAGVGEASGKAGATIPGRAKDILSSGELDFASKDTIASGKGHIASSIDNLFTTLADSIKSVRIEDTGGAFADLLRAKAGFKRMARAGHDIPRPQPPPARGAPWHPEWSDGRSKMQGTMLGGHGGVMGASMASASGFDLFRNLMRPKLGFAARGSVLNNPAQRTTSLLALRERRGFENETVAGQMAAGMKDARGVHVSGAQHAIRSGDRRRMQEVQRERLREKAGLEKTNSILEAIQRSFDAMVK